MRPIKDRAKRIKHFFAGLVSLISALTAYWTAFRAIRSLLVDGGYILEFGAFVLTTVLLAKFGLFFMDLFERLEKEIKAEDLAIKLQDPEFRKQYEQQREAERRAREVEEEKQAQERKWREYRQLHRQNRFREAQERLRQEQEEELKRTRALQLANVDEMGGLQFEKYLIHLLECQGYRTRHVGGSGDGGIDLIVEKQGEKVAVQAKRQKNPVNRRAVSDAVAGKPLHHCSGAMVITNSTFTQGARKLAQANSCILIDRQILAEWIIVFQQNGDTDNK